MTVPGGSSVVGSGGGVSFTVPPVEGVLVGTGVAGPAGPQGPAGPASTVAGPKGDKGDPGSGVAEFANQAAFPAAGVAGTLYFAKDSKSLFHWDGTKYELVSDWRSVLSQAKNVFTGKMEFNNNGFGGSFTPPYDTAVWIAPAPRINPTQGSQGLYVQHRVSGDLHAEVHDGAAAELRLSNASNTGVGQAAFEATVVLSGNTPNTINTVSSVLGNFVFEGAPTGTIDRISMLEATQIIQALPPGLTIDKVYSLKVDEQTYGRSENYTIYAPKGKSIFGPSKIHGDLTLVSREDASLSVVKDNNDKKLLVLYGPPAGTANYLQVNCAAAGGHVRLLANGTDANADISVEPKGTGSVIIKSPKMTGPATVDGAAVTTHVAVPASKGAPGKAGQVAYAPGFVYVCVADNTWQRAVLTDW